MLLHKIPDLRLLFEGDIRLLDSSDDSTRRWLEDFINLDGVPTMTCKVLTQSV